MEPYPLLVAPLFLGILLVASTATPCEPGIATKQPQVKLPEAEESWGSLLQGDLYQGEFVIENVGSAPLELTEVRPGCGCTKVSFDSKIAPGETGRVRFTVNTGQLLGEDLFKFIVVETNDPERPRFQYFLKGSVRPLFDVEPNQLLLKGLPGDDLSMSFTMTRAVDMSCEVKSVTPTAGVLETRLTPLEPGARYRVDIKAIASSQAGRKHEVMKLRVETGDGKIRELEYNAYVNYESRWLIESSGIFFSRPETEERERYPLTRTFEVGLNPLVRAREPEFRFKVLSARTQRPQSLIEVSTETVEPGTRYRVKVVVQEPLPTTAYSDMIVVESDDPSCPELRVVLRAYFPPKQSQKSKG